MEAGNAIRLSERLLKTVGLVTPGYRVADVGCDHAHTSIYLMQNHLAIRVLALDVNPGPLNKARVNVIHYGLERSIDVRRSDGMKEVSPGEVDVILIGGLGGRLMLRILRDGEAAVQKTRELVLQPQSEIPMVRRYLHENGYEITKDVAIKDEGKFYVALKAVPGSVERYDKDIFYKYGKIPLIGRSMALKEYLDREWRLHYKIKEDLKRAQGHSERALKRLGEVEAELKGIEEARSYYKGIRSDGTNQ